ncbi:MAG: hypothetical protein VB092_08455 [Oscillospiraceae bacterium]|nr:hypothetical protein [Oscillospiraceae bacterium]
MGISYQVITSFEKSEDGDSIPTFGLLCKSGEKDTATLCDISTNRELVEKMRYYFELYQLNPACLQFIVSILLSADIESLLAIYHEKDAFVTCADN